MIEKITDEERAKRKQLGLPLAKPLQYMKRAEGTFRKIGVVDFEIEETFPSGWSMLCITLENGEKIKIHSAYFAEMQKATFEKDIKKEREAF